MHDTLVHGVDTGRKFEDRNLTIVLVPAADVQLTGVTCDGSSTAIGQHHVFGVRPLEFVRVILAPKVSCHCAQHGTRGLSTDSQAVVQFLNRILKFAAATRGGTHAAGSRRHGASPLYCTVPRRWDGRRRGEDVEKCRTPRHLKSRPTLFWRGMPKFHPRY